MVSGVVLQVEILHILWRNLLDNPLQQVVKYSPPRDSVGFFTLGSSRFPSHEVGQDKPEYNQQSNRRSRHSLLQRI